MAVGKLQGSMKKDSIFCELKATGGEDAEVRATLKLATDTGVRKTILSRTVWEKIRKGPAQAGAKITMYVNDDDKDSSLLGESDALRLDIVNGNTTEMGLHCSSWYFNSI